MMRSRQSLLAVAQSGEDIVLKVTLALLCEQCKNVRESEAEEQSFPIYTTLQRNLGSKSVTGTSNGDVGLMLLLVAEILISIESEPGSPFIISHPLRVKGLR